MTPFRIFSGWDSRQAEAAEVFAFSVEKHCTMSVADGFVDAAVHPIRLGAPNGPCEIQWHFDGYAYVHGFKRQGTTEFSYSRFLVPWLCGYEGVAAFFDGCDQLCLGDVAELAAIDMADYAVRVVKHRVEGQVRPRIWSSVMLMDCAKLGWLTPEYVETAADNQLMRFGELGHASIGDLPAGWNVLVEPNAIERSDEETCLRMEGVRLLHWTALSNPNGGSWIDRSGSEVWREWRERWRLSR